MFLKYRFYYYSGMTRPIDQETVVTDKTAFILTGLKSRGPPRDGGAARGSTRVGQREGWGTVSQSLYRGFHRTEGQAG